MLRFFVKIITGFFLFFVVLIILSLFDLKLQDIGQGIKNVGDSKWIRRPVVAMKDFSENTLPRWGRTVRRKLLTLRSDRNPTRTSKIDSSTKVKIKNGSHKEKVQEVITHSEREELQGLLPDK